MAHEMSQTVQNQDGSWSNISGIDGSTLNPIHSFEKDTYTSVDEAVSAASQRSSLYGKPKVSGNIKNYVQEHLLNNTESSWNTSPQQLMPSEIAQDIASSVETVEQPVDENAYSWLDETGKDLHRGGASAAQDLSQFTLLNRFNDLDTEIAGLDSQGTAPAHWLTGAVPGEWSGDGDETTNYREQLEGAKQGVMLDLMNSMAGFEQYKKEIGEVHPDVKDAFSKIRDGGFWDSLASIIENPKALSNIVATSLGEFSPVLALSIATRGKSLPASMVTTAAGSYIIEYSNTIRHGLQEAGVDITSTEAIQKAFSDTELIDTLQTKAEERGIPIAIFDALSMGLAGKFYNRARTATRSQALNKTVGATGEVISQAALGGMGEVGAQLNTDGEITSMKDVAFEVAGEGPVGAVESTAGAYFDSKERALANAINTQVDATQTSQGALNLNANEGLNPNPNQVAPPQSTAEDAKAARDLYLKSVLQSDEDATITNPREKQQEDYIKDTLIQEEDSEVQWKAGTTEEYKKGLADETMTLAEKRLRETTEEWEKRLKTEADVKFPRDAQGRFYGEPGVSYTKEQYAAMQLSQGRKVKAYKADRNKARDRFFEQNKYKPQQESKDFIDIAAKKKAKEAAKKKADAVYKAQLFAPVDDLGFYSKAEKAVRSIKKGELRPELVFSITKKGKAVGILPEAGVSTKQIKKMGIDRMLKDKAANGEKVTKQELLDFVSNNKTVFSGEEYLSSGEDSEIRLDDTSMVGQQGANVALGDDNGTVAHLTDNALGYLGHGDVYDTFSEGVNWYDVMNEMHTYDPANYSQTPRMKIYSDMKAADSEAGRLVQALIGVEGDVVAELESARDEALDRKQKLLAQLSELESDKGHTEWTDDLRKRLLEDGEEKAYTRLGDPNLVNAISQAATNAAQAEYETDPSYEWLVPTDVGEYTVTLNQEDGRYYVTDHEYRDAGDYSNQEQAEGAIRTHLRDVHDIGGQGNTEWSDYTAPGLDISTYREIPVFATPIEGQGTPTQSQIEGHSMGGVFDGNTIAHNRVSNKYNRAGDEVLHVEEQQYDWAQTAREVGTNQAENDKAAEKAPARLRELSVERDRLQKKIDTGELASKALADTREDLALVDGKIAAKRRSIDKIKKGFIPKPPLDVIESMEAAVQDILRKAVDGGQSIVTWTTPQQQVDLYGRVYEELYNNIYGKNIPKFAKKYTEQFGGDVGRMDVWFGGKNAYKQASGQDDANANMHKNGWVSVFYIKIDGKLKKHLQKGMGYAKGGLVTNNPAERERAHQDYLNNLIK